MTMDQRHYTALSVPDNSPRRLNLREEIDTALDAPLSWIRIRENILDIFRAWLREQDARNVDGDELRIDP